MQCVVYLQPTSSDGQNLPVPHSSLRHPATHNLLEEMYHPAMHSQAPPQMQCRQQSFSNLAFGGEQEMPQQFLSYVPHQFMPFYNPNYHGKMSYPEAPLQCPPNGSCTDAASPTSLRKTGKAPRKPRTTNIVFPRRKAGEAQREAEP
eukprot:3149742-Rhodomonas_salina.1